MIGLQEEWNAYSFLISLLIKKFILESVYRMNQVWELKKWQWIKKSIICLSSSKGINQGSSGDFFQLVSTLFSKSILRSISNHLHASKIFKAHKITFGNITFIFI